MGWGTKSFEPQTNPLVYLNISLIVTSLPLCYHHLPSALSGISNHGLETTFYKTMENALPGVGDV